MALSRRSQKRIIVILVGLSSVLGLLFLSMAIYIGSVNTRLIYRELKMRSVYESIKANFEKDWAGVKLSANFPASHTRDLRSTYGLVMLGNKEAKAGAAEITMMAKMLDPHIDSSYEDEVLGALRNAVKRQKQLRQQLTEERRSFTHELKAFPASLLASYLGFPHIDHEREEEELRDSQDEMEPSNRSSPFKKKKQ